MWRHQSSHAHFTEILPLNISGSNADKILLFFYGVLCGTPKKSKGKNFILPLLLPLVNTLVFNFPIEGFCAKKAHITFWADFCFIQEQANFGKHKSAITEGCFSCQNMYVCQKLPRSCKKWKNSPKSDTRPFARKPSITSMYLGYWCTYEQVFCHSLTVRTVAEPQQDWRSHLLSTKIAQETFVSSCVTRNP